MSIDIPCVDTASQHQCWEYHFTRLLIVVSALDEPVFDLVQQCEVDSSLLNVHYGIDIQLALLMMKQYLKVTFINTAQK